MVIVINLFIYISFSPIHLHSWRYIGNRIYKHDSCISLHIKLLSWRRQVNFVSMPKQKINILWVMSHLHIDLIKLVIFNYCIWFLILYYTHPGIDLHKREKVEKKSWLFRWRIGGRIVLEKTLQILHCHKEKQTTARNLCLPTW